MILGPDAESAEERQKFKAHLSIGPHAENLLNYVEAAKKEFLRVINFGSLGMCWGGKVVAVTSGEDTPFKVSGSAHPA
jgi:dienelactone hydrolase